MAKKNIFRWNDAIAHQSTVAANSAEKMLKMEINSLQSHFELLSKHFDVHEAAVVGSCMYSSFDDYMFHVF